MMHLFMSLRTSNDFYKRRSYKKALIVYPDRITAAFTNRYQYDLPRKLVSFSELVFDCISGDMNGFLCRVRDTDNLASAMICKVITEFVIEKLASSIIVFTFK